VGEGLSPIRAALALAPLSLGMVIGMVGSFALVARLGRKARAPGIVIAALGLVGIAATAAAADHPSPWAMVPGALAVGIGAGLVFGQLFDVTLGGVADREVGSASGLLNALQQLAFTLGIAAVATIFFDVLGIPRLPSVALEVTALAAIVPLAVSF
jgi:MFS family permease